MIEIIKNKTNIDFVGMFKMTGIFSLILVVGSIFLAATSMKYGVDFRGGGEIQIKFEKTVQTAELRKTLGTSGYTGIVVQTIGDVAENEFLLKVPASGENLNAVTDKISEVLTTNYKEAGLEIRKVDIVGPKAGSQLRISGFQAMGWAMIAIMVYIGLRFDFKFAPGAIIALFHDVSIILGFYALTGTEFSLQTVGALLAVIGYSVNDTVIVFDRIREHETKFPGLSLASRMNTAINDTLSRTVLTSTTTLFISISMLLVGGEAIHDFFLAMTIGIVVGTYSSVFVATPFALILDKVMKKKVVAQAA